MIVEFEPIPDGVSWSRDLGATGDMIIFHATHLNRDYNRPHATCTIALNDRILAYDYLSMSKDTDRTHIVNSAWSQVDDELIQEAYPKKFLKHDFDLFCKGAYDAYIGSQTAEEMSGDILPTTLDYLIDPWIVEGGGSILFGAPGAGKSWMVMLMAVAVDAGVQWPWSTRQAKTLFVNIERNANLVRRRLGRVNAALGLAPDRPLLTFNGRGRSLRDIKDSLHSTIAKHKVEFLVLDSISRAGYGKLTADDSANAVVDELNNLCPTWIGIGHQSRQDGTHVFGSIHFDAGADITIRCLSEQRGDTVGVNLSTQKVNEGVKGFKQMLALEMDRYGLSHVRMSTEQEFTELAMIINNTGSTGMTVTENLVQELKERGSATATELAEALGSDRTYLSRILNKSDLFVSNRAGREMVFSLAAVNTPSVPRQEEEDATALPF